MNYDIDPEHRNALLEQAALGGPQTHGGITVRPMTIRTYSLYYMLVGRLEKPDWTFRLYSFVWLHSIPEERISLVPTAPDAAVRDVYQFMDTVEMESVLMLRNWMESELDKLAATITASNAALAAQPSEAGKV